MWGPRSPGPLCGEAVPPARRMLLDDQPLNSVPAFRYLPALRMNDTGSRPIRPERRAGGPGARILGSIPRMTLPNLSETARRPRWSPAGRGWTLGPRAGDGEGRSPRSRIASGMSRGRALTYQRHGWFRRWTGEPDPCPRAWVPGRPWPAAVQTRRALVLGPKYSSGMTRGSGDRT